MVGLSLVRRTVCNLSVWWCCVGHFLSVLFQTLRRNMLLFVCIVLVLIAAKWIRSEWTQVQQIVDDVPALRTAQQDVSGHRAASVQDITRRVGRMSGATVQQLDGEIAALDKEIGVLQRARGDVSLPAVVLSGDESIGQQLARHAMNGASIELRRQAKAHLIALRAYAVVLLNRQAAQRNLEQLRLSHLQLYAAFQHTQQRLAEVQARAGVLARIPFTTSYRQAEKLKADLRSLRFANNRAHQDFVRQQALLRQMSLPAGLTAFRLDEQRLERVAAPLRERLARADSLAAKSHVWQAYQTIRPVLPVALALLIAWWLVPAAIRTFFYFGLAPLAARRPPIVLAASQGDASGSRSNLYGTGAGSVISAVSQRVSLAPDDELLIRPDYCQSQPAGVDVTTKLLFDWRRWFTSIAAHLWMLKRFRTTQAATIVVSSTADALDEVAMIELAAGEAMVLQPRALVGMAYRGGQRPRIRSHWRLGTLHAWLTLQLRYLAFEGPATLIVKGCRGVRLENAATGRTISQDATLGFSTNARYATVRAEPFIPYLRGRQPLFQDAFSGQDAYYLYEEVPRHAQANGRNRNPLEVLFDAGLKAFGI